MVYLSFSITEGYKVKIKKRFSRSLVMGLLSFTAITSYGGLKISSLDPVGKITWAAPPGESVLEYRLECTTNLTVGAWTDLGCDIELGNVMTGEVSCGVDGSRFYRVKAVVPNYMVVDISGGPDASNYPISYLTDVPTGGWTDEYKTTKLVLRRISAGSFIMGSPSGELGRLSDEIQHQVTLTKDFYLGVFEVTQKQWMQVRGEVFAFIWGMFYFTNPTCWETRPSEYLCGTKMYIRGNSAGEWPSNSNVASDSFMGYLRAKTDRMFDLPTEAQWEYAARAGTTSALNSGENLLSSMSCSNMAEVGRYFYNGGSTYTQNSSTNAGSAAVGSYLPNAWGLYDMHGNVAEWCMDWYGEYPTDPQVDPQGPITGTERVLRGGNFNLFAASCRSARRFHSVDFDSGDGEDFSTVVFFNNVGFRVAILVE